MNDFTALLTSRDRTAATAHSARPDSPVRPDAPSRDLRHRISTAIFRLADRIDPAPAPTRPGTPSMAGTGR